ncbi:MAG: hypothetical protein ACREN4_03585 [Candidatus Dormibacteria bacterium]
MDQLAAVGLQPSERGVAVAITGATSAPGRSWLSVNLAVALAAAGASVALVDADPHLGTVAVQLGLAESRSLNFLAHEATLRPIDDQLLQGHVQVSHGVTVLGGKSLPGQQPDVPTDVLERVLSALRQDHRFVLVDAGALECAASQAVALLCQLVVWVAVPTRLGLDLLDRVLSGPLAPQVRSKPGLAILNRTGPDTLREAEAAFRQRYGISVGACVAESRRGRQLAAEGPGPAALTGQLGLSLRACARTVAAAASSMQLSRPEPGVAELSAARVPGGG